MIPWCTYTYPEVARVGLNETVADAQGIPFEISEYGLNDLDRAITDGADLGFVKVLTNPGKDKILEVTNVGNGAGDLLAEFTLAFKYNLGLNKIMSTIHPYPTMSEAAKYTAGVWKKKAPVNLLKLMKKFHAWRRG